MTTRRILVASTLTALIFLWPVSSVQAGFFSASNFWECILERMPDVDNDGTAMKRHRQCEKEFPATEEYEKDVLRMFGPANFEQCTSDYMMQPRSIYGRTVLRHACYRLFSNEKIP